MNGGHDLGGMHGFGPVLAEADEPPFHAHWEKRMLAMTVAMGATGGWNIDMSRHARENRPAHHYLAMSYYEIWYAGLTTLLVQHGLVDADEIAAGRSLHAAVPAKQALKAADVPGRLARGGPSDRPALAQPRFGDGDMVRAKRMNPLGHTRLPQYARGARGIIHRVNGNFVFPDTNAAGQGEQPQHCYSVKFSARELWGEDADARHFVYIDLWEKYLEPA